MSRESFDIVIAGGGMVGSTLALALAPLGLRVALVEAVARQAGGQPSFDDRSTAMSRSTQRMYEAMGLWNDIVAASTPVRHIHVSDRGRFGFSHIDADEQGVEALGYVVINRVLGEVLQRGLQQQPALTQFCPARIVGCEAGDDAMRVSLSGDGAGSTDLDCRLLVAADGAGSSVRGMLGIPASRKDYGQTAVVGNLRPGQPMRGIAYERFTEQGPLAMLPISEGRAGFVWVQATAAAERAMQLDDAAFLAEIQAAFGQRLGSFSRVGTRACYPLVLSKAECVTAPRAVLIGNAAHGLHPVAAQGFNLGLRDVAALCDCLVDAQQAADGNFDAGAPELLWRYADWRRDDQQKLLGFTDGLVTLFSQSSGPARALRNLGMLGFDLVPGVRSLFARHTMGLAGRLPRLSRGVPLQ